VVGFEGKLVFDASKPVGTMRKLLDAGRLRAMGWTTSVSIEAGVDWVYRDFIGDAE
jgi:GDP-L-fucose synthase